MRGPCPHRPHWDSAGKTVRDGPRKSGLANERRASGPRVRWADAGRPASPAGRRSPQPFHCPPETARPPLAETILGDPEQGRSFRSYRLAAVLTCNKTPAISNILSPVDGSAPTPGAAGQVGRSAPCRFVIIGEGGRRLIRNSARPVQMRMARAAGRFDYLTWGNLRRPRAWLRQLPIVRRAAARPGATTSRSTGMTRLPKAAITGGATPRRLRRASSASVPSRR